MTSGFGKIKVHLGLLSRVEGESAYLAFHFSVFDSVDVILGASGGKIDGVIPRFQSTVEFAEIITRGWHRLG